MAKNGTKKGKVGSGENTEDLDNLKDKLPEDKKDASETELIDEDKDGNRFLPGNEIIVPKEIKPLIESVRKIEKILKPNFAKARDALTAEQDRVSELAHKNIEHFSEADEKGTRTYKYGGCIVKITFEKEKILTKLDEEE